jgi:hypothetical protein
MNADNTDCLRSIASTTAGRAYRVHQRCPFKKTFHLLYSTCLDPLYQRTLTTKNELLFSLALLALFGGGNFAAIIPVICVIGTFAAVMRWMYGKNTC